VNPFFVLEGGVANGGVDMTVALTFTKEMDKDHMVMPGDNCELVCELVHPIALDKGMRFTIRMPPFAKSVV